MDNEHPLVQFQSEAMPYARPVITEKPGITALVVKYSGGALRNEKEAGYFLVILSVLMLGAAFYFLWSSNSTNTTRQQTAAKIQDAINATNAPH